MFGSGILDTVIGMMFVFLLVSMLVTIMSEMIAARMMSRAKLLREGVDRLLGSKWGKLLYEHPLIEGSGRDGVAMKAGQDGPSYIPSRSFANVVMNLVEQNSAGLALTRQTLHEVLDAASATGASLEQLKVELGKAAVTLRASGKVGAAAAEDLQRRLEAPQASNRHSWLAELQARIPQLRSSGEPAFTSLLHSLDSLVVNGNNAALTVQQLRSAFDGAVAGLLSGPATLALKEELTDMGRRLQGPYTVGDAIADFRWFTNGISSRHVRHLIEELPEAHVRTVLLTLFDDAGHDVEKFKQNIEVWFNNGMDRVSGWYKRHSQVVVTILALVTVVALNVDAVAIFRHLQTDQGARAALAAKATAYVEAQKTPAPVAAAPNSGNSANSGNNASGAVAGTGTGTGTPASPATAVAAAAIPAAPRVLSSGMEYNETAQIGNLGKEGKVEIRSTDPAVTIVTPGFVLSKQTSSIPFTLSSLGSDKPKLFDVEIRLNKEIVATLHYRLNPSLDYQFEGIRNDLMALSLPIGWVSKETAAGEGKKGMLLPSTVGDGWTLFKQHLLGWLLTALAATLGAPFWFDTLNRVIAIRATGKAPEEDPKAPKSVSVPLEPGQSPQEADRLRGAGR